MTALYKYVFPPRCRAAELLLLGGIFAEAGGEQLSARDPDLRCLSTPGVGSEVDSDVRELFGFGTRHLRICEETPDCQTPAAAFCNVQTPTQELERRWFSVSRAELLRVMFEYIRSFMLLRSSLGSDPIKRMNTGTRRVQLI